MRIPKKVVETVDVAVIEIHAKVCDSGSYTLKSSDGKEIATLEDYVPKFFPGEHYGDYLILEVDIHSGKILNWKEPDPTTVAQAFGLISEEE